MHNAYSLTPNSIEQSNSGSSRINSGDQRSFGVISGSDKSQIVNSNHKIYQKIESGSKVIYIKI